MALVHVECNCALFNYIPHRSWIMDQLKCYSCAASPSCTGSAQCRYRQEHEVRYCASVNTIPVAMLVPFVQEEVAVV